MDIKKVAESLDLFSLTRLINELKEKRTKQLENFVSIVNSLGMGAEEQKLCRDIIYSVLAEKTELVSLEKGKDWEASEDCYEEQYDEWINSDC